MLENFWNEKFWFPENITWKDLKPGFRDGIEYRNYIDLLWSIPFAVAFTALRLSFIKYLLIPLGLFLKIKPKREKPTEIAIFEKIYKKSKKLPTDKELANLKKQTDISKREIERWWRKRRAHDRPTSLDKIGANCWRFLFYSLNFMFGLSILWNKSWMWNFIDMFRKYPRHSLDNGLWWYYNITLAFYTAQTVLHFFETRRKDFWQMFIHHILTISLILTSWITNFIRGGSLIVFVHDIADIFLEGAKTFKSANFKKVSSVFFILFGIVWIITRLAIYPRIIYSIIFEYLTFFQPYPVYYIFVIMLLLLLGLHFIWSYMIFLATKKVIQTNKFEDVRSSTDTDTESHEN